jgi:hypothetical protein
MARKWTVMVYLGADNSLSVDFLWNLKEMQEVGVGPEDDKLVTVVAQYDPAQGIPTQRYIINNESHKVGNSPDSRDGFLILDDEQIPKLSDEKELKTLITNEHKAIIQDCQAKINTYMKTPKGQETLREDTELNTILGMKVDKEQEKLVKEYIKTPNGQKKLSEDPELRKLVFALRGGIEREERFKEYMKTLEGQKDPLNKNTGDPMRLLQFIFWGINSFQAERYMVVLAGHGSGAVEDFLLKDDNSRDSLTLHELRDVFQLVQKELNKLQLHLSTKRQWLRERLEREQLEESERLGLEKKLQHLNEGEDRIDILGMDSCLMSMAEVYYQLVGSVEYLVGAEGFESSGGWPYQRILRSLAQNSDELTEKIAKKIVDDYVLYYFDYALAGLSVDLSACRIEEGKLLPEKIRDLASALKVRLENRASHDIVISARQRTQSYKFDQYVDLCDFCDQLKSDTRSDQDLKTCCDNVRGAVEAIVKNSSYVGPDYQKSNGLSVYFPWNSVPERFSNGYEQLEFTRLTEDKWHQFLTGFTEAIRAQVGTSDEITVDESNIRYAGKTLYSARTLYAARTPGPGGSLYMAYSKAPSIVWKPKGSVEDHFQELWREEITNRILTALGRKIYWQPESSEVRPKFEEVILKIFAKLNQPISQGAEEAIKTHIGELQSLTGININANTLTESLLAARKDLTEYLGVDEVKPEALPGQGRAKGAGT